MNGLIGNVLSYWRPAASLESLEGDCLEVHNRLRAKHQVRRKSGSSKRTWTFSQPYKEKCISEVARIGSVVVIFYLSKL